ncbi:MAG: VWA-like domain-containing protein [Clostridiales bacterium]|nr:VWA-like domain-containing protein [Clostridiales bacterium]
MAQQREEMAKELAENIMTLARNTLMVHLRFMDRAISHLTLTCDGEIPFATDGRALYYEPWTVLQRYQAEPNAVNRDIMHALLHCVFRHWFVGQDIDRARWDAACDAAVECAISDLHSPVLQSQREVNQLMTLEMLRREVGTMTAERIYRWLDEQDYDEDDLYRLRRELKADEHGLWYGGLDPDAERQQDVDDLEQMWQDVSRRMQTELETMRQEAAGVLVQNLRSLNRAKHDYTAFLRRFGVRGEVVRLSDEEFDNNYYTYGLSLYGNVPLIEPLEYREQKRIRDFVIAIDTSGSVKGDVVQSFIQHTHDILSRQENFFTKVNMHIIQCDDQVREDVHITGREEFQAYIKTMQIKGLGQTDFRPVFARVEELIRRRELTDLRGLLYFTDGLGTFPEKKPPYDTAFIIHTDDYHEVQVPPWAMHMVLTEDEILDSRFSNA